MASDADGPRARRADEHPLARWATVGTLLASFAAGAWFIMDERERGIAHGETLAKVRADQTEIRKELAGLTLLLTRVADDQADMTAASDDRFATRASEHRDLAEGVNWIRGALSRGAPTQKETE